MKSDKNFNINSIFYLFFRIEFSQKGENMENGRPRPARSGWDPSYVQTEEDFKKTQKLLRYTREGLDFSRDEGDDIPFRGRH